jgi:hypothetical protein
VRENYSFNIILVFLPDLLRTAIAPRLIAMGVVRIATKKRELEA